MLRKGLLIRAELCSSDILDLVEKKIIGCENDRPLGYQPPRFKGEPLVFCSYYCEGYEQSYQNQGITFETDAEIRYASPVESWRFLREGVWIQGHEQFLFPTIEGMLEAYPNSFEFQKAFQSFFKALTPREVFPKHTKNDAETFYYNDEAHESPKFVYCNEVCFSSPLRIRDVRAFYSRDELRDIFSKVCV